MKYFIGLFVLVAFSTIGFSQQFQVKDSTVKMGSVAEPLVIVDGKILPKLVPSKADSTKMVSPLENLDQSEIAGVEVLKNLNAVSEYGEAGKNGVIKITMKRH